MTATGVGSMPGTDIGEAVRIVAGELPDLLHLPELPARGPTAALTGRGTALLEGLTADLQPAGWRLQDASGIDHRRAKSLLAQDLDVLQEHSQDYRGRLKVQVAGPWTLAATMERPRGDRVLADVGARRELAQSLAAGVSAHVDDLQHRVPGATLLVQVDEPALPAVLAGAVPTASGFSRHRTVTAAEAQAALAAVVDAIASAGASPVAHVCAADVPVGLLVTAGFRVVSYDRANVVPAPAWAEAYDAGVDLWPGVVPAVDPTSAPKVGDLVDSVRRWYAELGFEPDPDRMVVTPACGLAGASEVWTREALRLVTAVAAALAD